MIRRYDVLCVGSAVLDKFLTTDCSLKSVKLGDKVLVSHQEVHSGGGATNSAAALSKLGLKVKLLTKLGNDHDAEFILKELKQYKLKNICLKHSKKSTDFSTIISCPHKDRDRIIYVHKGASRDISTNDFNKSQLKAKWIYLASLMGKSFQTGKEIAQYAKKKKINLLFNPSLYLAKKGKRYLKSVLDATNILVLNKEEAQVLLSTQSGSHKKLLMGLHQLGPETVIISNGRKMLYTLHENNIYSTLPTDIKVTHTAGAGDAFTAGLLAGIIKKYDFEDALKLGIANSLSVIQSIGTKNGLLTEPEAKKLIKKYKIKVVKHAL
ncbi:carbohydrate kinase family protein [Candidatus Woesearchaeota archaeon]|jgi:sugar/nucleoside kinase (ribokinase family)|nr:carbohydrate kinase family protein [Candidatus Woesearchaeota archaeon]MBT4110230.1 carbohydrate kinase family protein [Candidatus Woesearchaeota archaeon]MBT4336246.1 carbohydrate kinase family protein [Candidatus Woesearchaeota archaeon]MBT4468775.1 carbohydrate kinase family protein [Candidatus Woesearchaeota archaeon]MBT6744906.1 carbohydrate kinase family protein [Candidatus Woesearchaeota archaeon]